VAAEILLKLACEDIQSGMDRKALNKRVMKIKEGNYILESLEKQVKVGKESFDTKINTLDPNLQNVKQLELMLAIVDQSMWSSAISINK
jgi:hypothetical protein